MGCTLNNSTTVNNIIVK